MAIRGDTNGLEKSYLLDMLPHDSGRVLEIGCGDGRLTRKYAERAAYIAGVDLPGALKATQGEWPPVLPGLAAASGEALPFYDGSFDTVLFSLSL